jgi:hypothetical protein
MKTPDPTEEIKAVRHRLGEQFDFDLDRIYADIEKRQESSGREYLTLPAKRIVRRKSLSDSRDSVGIERSAQQSDATNE